MLEKLSKEKAQAYGITLPDAKIEKTLSPNQIAKILGVTGEAVKVWISRGRLPAAKQPNGYWLVTVSDFERFLEARRRAPQPRVFFEGPSTAKKEIERLGYEVIEAANLADAMLKLASAGVNLIVLDAASKRIPVFDLLQQKKRIKSTKRTPALFLGGIAETEIGRASALDVKGVVSDVSALPDEIKRVLSCG